MRIAISATAPSLEADVDHRFGRCPYFVIVDPDTMEFETIDNTTAMTAGGAGISTAQMIANKGVKAVLTGNCGPNAHEVLSVAGVEIFTGVGGRVEDAAKSHKAGLHTPSPQPNVASHFGACAGAGMGMGNGCGGGQGGGGGRHGQCKPISSSQEAEMLKAQLEELKSHMERIQQRIDELGRDGG